MANPNPNPATRFSAGNPGRAKQKGARDRMSAAFLTALADDFEAHGKEAVERVRQEDPSTYLRVFASLAPKELEIHRPLDGITEEMLAEAIAVLQGVVMAGEHSASEPTPASVN